MRNDHKLALIWWSKCIEGCKFCTLHTESVMCPSLQITKHAITTTLCAWVNAAFVEPNSGRNACLGHFRFCSGVVKSREIYGLGHPQLASPRDRKQHKRTYVLQTYLFGWKNARLHRCQCSWNHVLRAKCEYGGTWVLSHRRHSFITASFCVQFKAVNLIGLMSWLETTIMSEVNFRCLTLQHDIIRTS